jgi:hypothetical protein
MIFGDSSDRDRVTIHRAARLEDVRETAKI